MKIVQTVEAATLLLIRRGVHVFVLRFLELLLFIVVIQLLLQDVVVLS